MIEKILGGRGEYVQYVTENIPLPAKGLVAILSGIGG